MRPMSAPPRPQTLSLHTDARAGYTLIELMVVIVLLAIVVTITVVSLDGFLPDQQIKSASRAVRQRLELARVKAAATGRNFAVVYDLDEQSMWLLVPEGEESAEALERETETGRRENRRELLKLKLEDFNGDIQFIGVQQGEESEQTDGLITIEISPLGTGSGHIVTLKDKKTDQVYSLELNPLTGLTTLYDYERRYKEVEDHVDD